MFDNPHLFVLNAITCKSPPIAYCGGLILTNKINNGGFRTITKNGLNRIKGKLVMLFTGQLAEKIRLIRGEFHGFGFLLVLTEVWYLALEAYTDPHKRFITK